MDKLFGCGCLSVIGLMTIFGWFVWLFVEPISCIVVSLIVVFWTINFFIGSVIVWGIGGIFGK